VFFSAMVAGTTFFISLEPGGPSQFPGIARSTKFWRKKFFVISRGEFCLRLLEVGLNEFVDASADHAFSQDVSFRPLSPTTTSPHQPLTTCSRYFPPHG
jgi:hypothetical protein